MLRFAIVLLLTLPAMIATAADLRVETRVYVGEEETPFSESTTLMQGDVTFDFRPGESQVTIFRAGVAGKPGRFILLDTKQEIRTEIGVDKIAAVMHKLRQWAGKQEDPFLRFTGLPTFEEDFNEETGVLILASEPMTYRLVTVPMDHPEMKLPVRQFLDAFAQLQTLLNAGLPPEPRLKVNEALFRHEVMPVQVELTSRDEEKPALRAEHLMAWVLSKHDRSRIEESLDQMTSFREVTNEEFHRGRKQVAAK